MLFNSYEFLLFFPVVTVLYFIFPKKSRYVWLLVTSYFFYMSWNPRYVFLLLASTVMTYLAAAGMDMAKKREARWGKERTKRRKKLCVLASLAGNLGILFIFKYANFVLDTMQVVLDRMHLSFVDQRFDVLLPVGISFYIFQALGYTIDVYRGEVETEKNFLRYALFVSFFPQLVAGPIERSKNLLAQLKEEHTFSYIRMRDGLYLMLWGYFLKMVLADRIAVFVDSVYGDLQVYTGFYVLIASILFAFQIYCDFAGYSTIAMGAAQILGFRLMENFNAPYFAVSVAEFWRRWHISLSSWFRDYLYIPLGGNQKGVVRKYGNLMAVFLCSGLWHGADWTYVAWGGLNGLFQVAGSMTVRLREKLHAFLGLDRTAFSHRLMKTVFTFAFVDFTWIFFRASSLSDAFLAVKSVFCLNNPWILFDGSLYGLGLVQKEYQLVWAGIGLLLLADFLKSRGVCIRKEIVRQEWWFRWAVGIGGVLAVLVLGKYGTGYDIQNFIYFQF